MSNRTLGDRYQLREVIGRGGMATVWRASDLRLDRTVAVKVLHAPVMADPEVRERLRREARTAARLAHPNIVAMHDADIDHDTGYLVMELVDGRSLADVLTGGPLPVEQAVSIGAQVCAALAAAHHAGIVHRDVKPGNLLVTVAGTVKVCDFGIARWQTPTVDATLTHPGQVLGTSDYLAPERATGAPGDARSDLYALGCVMYAMLTGTPPFTGENPLSVAHRHVHQAPQPLRAHRPDIPPDLDRLVTQLLAKNPADRPASAEAAGSRMTSTTHAAGGRAPAFGVGVASPHTTVLPALAPAAPGLSPTMGLPVVVDDHHGRLRAPARRQRRIWGLAAAVLLLVLGLITVNALTGAHTAAGPTASAPSTGVASPSDSPPPASPPPSTPADQVAALQSLVAQQASAGQLDPHTAADLQARLDDLARRLRRGQDGHVNDRIAQLRDQLAELQKDGKLGPDVYQALASGLDRLTAALPTPGNAHN